MNVAKLKFSYVFRSLFWISVSLILTNCVAETTDEHSRAEYAKAHIVGMSRAAVVGCAGEPQFTALKDKGKTEVLIYQVEHFRKRKHSGTELQNCEANFDIKEGHVSNVSYKGKSGGVFWNQYKACAPIITKCVDHVKISS